MHNLKQKQNWLLHYFRSKLQPITTAIPAFGIWSKNKCLLAIFYSSGVYTYNMNS